MHEFRNGANDALVKTTKGFVKGYFYDGLNIFKGIPYAKAQRFHSPSEVDPWEGVKNTTIYGATCPNFGDNVPGDDLAVPHRYWPQSEDCLNLNVWTPGLDNKKRPVIVWLHGGGFTSGSAIEHVAYDGANMAKFGNSVVISINHRLNVLGYLDCSTFGDEYKNSGNVGNEDILYSLKWINKNIEAFGGDKENVTLIGHSGGGMKVTCMLQCPEADGLFHKAIIMSGVMDEHMSNEEPDNGEFVRTLINELKLGDISELEKVPYKHLVRAYKEVSKSFKAQHKYVGCNPIRNDFYTGNPLVYGFRENAKTIPTIVSSVYSEFGGAMPFPIVHNVTSDEQVIGILSSMFGKETVDKLVPLFKKTYQDRSLSDLIFTDFAFRPASIRYVLEMSKNNKNVYNTLFTKDSLVKGGVLPSHCADIPYVFHNCELVPSTQEGEVTERLEKEIFGCVKNFVRTGNPNHEGIDYWPNVVDGVCNTFIFDKVNYVGVNHDVEFINALQLAIMPMVVKMFENM